MTEEQIPGTQIASDSTPWIKLKGKIKFSRLLYTNPVCFLSTIGEIAPVTTSQTSAETRTVDGHAAKPMNTQNASDTETPPAKQYQRNVMVLSWLTATNNSGRFMFSINRRRHTASSFFAKHEAQQQSYFILSVPVKGMESLVKHVGQASGRWGSKFTEDHIIKNNDKEEEKSTSTTEMSKWQKKKLKFEKGVPTLNAVPLFGTNHHSRKVNIDMCQDNCQEDQLFAIEGTVAHLKCKAYRIMEEGIDDDHYLVLAEVEEAAVHPSYWDKQQNLFRPASDSTPPYLSFFGSGTFGYVVT
mmetsp:Transcript_22405/g.34538  ORF Transcript_22405/g.34538 Transcript_22405/m.34538 type:complete len:299 (+) Transcript_22405:1357-2253(+)